MRSVHCLRKPKAALRFPEFGNWEHVFDIKLFASKIAKRFSFGAISHSDVVFFGFPIKLSEVLTGYALCCMFFSPFFLKLISLK